MNDLQLARQLLAYWLNVFGRHRAGLQEACGAKCVYACDWNAYLKCDTQAVGVSFLHIGANRLPN